MQRFLAEVKGVLPAGSIVTEALQRAALGRDASFYRLVPQAVLKVHNEAEVARVLQSAQQHQVPVTFRAAGTSLSGQGVSDSVLVRLSLGHGNWMDMHLLDDKGSAVRMGPGVIGGQANSLLLPLGRRLGPDPASVDSAMVGGIVANNASGMCCGVAQNSYHTLMEVRAVFANGQVLDTSDSGSVEQFRASMFGDRLLAGLAQLRDEILGDSEMSARIRKKFEIKCTTGYSMNAFTDYIEPLEILKHLLVGSEGTLAFLSSISLATVPEHRHKASSLLLFPSIQEACEAATMLKEADVADAAELMDAASLAATNRQVRAGNQRLPEGLQSLLVQADGASAALLVEVRGASAAALAERLERVAAVLSQSAFTVDAGFSTDPVVCSSYWGVRKGLLPIAGSGRPRGSTLLLEDIAAPTDQLANLTHDVKELFRSLHYEETVLFGHALDGNLHLLFSEEFSLGGESQRYASLMDRLCSIVVGKYDGSCKAEHGTGRNVAPFVEMEWGTPVWDLMWRVKDLFDPAAVLNPGVVLNRDPTVHLQNIKGSPPVHDLVDECIECGFCESVCPSRDLTFTPRQRIAALRELESARHGLPGCLDSGLASLEETMEYAGKDTWAGDSMCATKCPVGIDTGALVKDLRNASLSPAEHRVGAYLAKHMAWAMSSARHLLRLVEVVHSALGAPLLCHASRFLSRMGGALGVRLPQWQADFPAANSTFVKDWKECLAERRLDAELAYLPSCSTRCMGGTAGSGTISTTAAILSLFKKASTPVAMSPACDGLCCGLAWESRGMPELGDEMARQYLNEAARMMGKERPVLIDSSPCFERLKRFAKKQGDAVQLIGTVEAMQLLRDRLDWQPKLNAVEVHVPCSAKIGQGTAASEAAISELLRGTALPEGAPIASSGVSCCGMAGDRGLRFPELVQAATSSRGPRLAESSCRATRVSISRTCEIAMAAESLPVILDNCASPLKLR